MVFENPIIRGFHPDPCLCKKGSDYYIATSTFEYYPGIKIYHSKDLQQWDYLISPLTSDYADLTNVPSSGGIWAPDLSYKESEDMFYLTYTIVSYFEKYTPYQGFKDTHNYVIKAKDITGPWSNPIYLNSWGFDPSIIHDSDRRSYFMCMKWNYRARSNNFDGIVLQEYDTQKNILIGDKKVITKGTNIKTTEGPHIYHIGDYYYLFLAEGGTSYNHTVSVLRSSCIWGPYEIHPDGELLTQAKNRNKISEAKENPLLYCKAGLQKTGHASIAQIQGNEYVMSFLCARPNSKAFCPLGRETALLTISFCEDGWPRLDEDVSRNIIQSPPKPYDFKDDFSGKEVSKDWDFLRYDFLSKQNVILSNGHLTIEGGESPASIKQHFIGIPIPEYEWQATTRVLFDPEDYQQMAGMSIRYNESNQYYLAISRDDLGNKIIMVCSCILKKYDIITEELLKEGLPIYLKVECNGDNLSFFYGYSENSWIKLNVNTMFQWLSDDAIKPIGFTGSYCGLMVNDMSGNKRSALFDYFHFKTINTSVGDI